MDELFTQTALAELLSSLPTRGGVGNSCNSGVLRKTSGSGSADFCIPLEKGSLPPKRSDWTLWIFLVRRLPTSEGALQRQKSSRAFFCRRAFAVDLYEKSWQASSQPPGSSHLDMAVAPVFTFFHGFSKSHQIARDSMSVALCTKTIADP